MSPDRAVAAAAFHLRAARTLTIAEFQYRAPNLLLMLAMVVEPVIYLALWQTVARANGGAVQGWDANDIAAYYLVWTLVRQLNMSVSPYAMERKIQHGMLTVDLLRPLHPFHYDIARFVGWKITMMIYWAPIAALLSLAFRPSWSAPPLAAPVFVVAALNAFVIRSLYMWLIGLITFWTTRAGAVFDMAVMLEMFLSGRLLPVDLLPGWAVQVSALLPFRWVFAFPIETAIGRLDTAEMLLGLVMQLVWIAAGIGCLRLVWPAVVRRFSAVGN